ncbi:iron-containing alcohol dehydrogenase [Methylophaga thiooxydans]|uniref:Alcohol dehydrogenase, iron-containing superfamily n=1 Tax=Methylophaga thiooxydans DMS010 TaxID=637616 RepID=C0N9E4_9GAMM|nr:iron-containing alcohol dehydrogenase [Methylophaga thiooxydans]EEF78580.1 alcohol dehydrogenase, iron-containing superfamily [Methylophaga thiooxydans DMS010]
MNNFNFFNPTRIVFGEGQIKEIDQLVPKDARVLILFGGQSAKKHGTVDEVTAALNSRYSEEFGGIEANPSYTTLMRAVAQIKDNKLDYLLAVGGGSVIDGTKFIAAAVNCEGDPWQEILVNSAKDIHTALPFGSVLTLPATGSEMNANSVVTRYQTKEKLAFKSPLVYPEFSILDPTKAYTLPPRQLANGIVDAYTHIMEQYLTYPVDAKVQDRFAEGLLLTLIETGPELLEKPTDYTLQSNFMWTATLALNGLIGAGVPQDWATHMIGHELTALHGLDHAQTLAIILPSIMQEQREHKHDKLLQYAERVWNITDGDDDSRIDMAITKTRDFFEQMGVKTRLSDYQIPADAIPTMIKQLGEHGLNQLGEHGDVDLDKSRKVLEASL